MTTPRPTGQPLDDAHLDALLAQAHVPAPSAGLRRAILLAADARGETFWRALWRELGGLRVAGPALAASLALGVAVATLLPDVAGDSTEPSVDALADETAPDYTELALFDAAYEDYAL